MKKLKIMLMSFAILAVVGGALAFNALGTTPYCTTFTNSQAQQNFCTFSGILTTCPIPQAGKLGSGSDPLFCYTTDADGTHDCKLNGGAFLDCQIVPTQATID